MVRPIFSGETVAILATGPSLNQADVDSLRGRVRVLAVNDSYLMSQWADVLYACDNRWWAWQYQYHNEAIHAFAGLRFAMQPTKDIWPGVTVLRNTGQTGLELEPGGLKTGRNSGYQAINLAVQFGAARILLLGYDMSLGHGGRSHWFGEHPNGQKPPLTKFRLLFPTIAGPLKAAGVEVLNCSRRSALTCFPKVALERALSPRRVAA